MAERILWAIFHPKTLLDGYIRRGKDMCELMGENDRLIRANTEMRGLIAHCCVVDPTHWLPLPPEVK